MRSAYASYFVLLYWTSWFYCSLWITFCCDSSLVSFPGPAGVFWLPRFVIWQSVRCGGGERVFLFCFHLPLVILYHHNQMCPQQSWPVPLCGQLRTSREKGKKVKVIWLCPTLCNPMVYTVHGILQSRILEWVVFPLSRGPSQPRDWTWVSHIVGRFFTSWGTSEALERFFTNSSLELTLTSIYVFHFPSVEPIRISFHWITD